MLKGEISNKFAPTIVIDINLIYQKDTEGWLNKALSLVGNVQFKLIDKRIPKYLERWFYKDYTIYIVDRNKEYDVPEKLIEGWCYTRFFKIGDLKDMEAMIDQEKVVLAVFDRDYPALAVGRSKALNFISWEDLFRRVR